MNDLHCGCWQGQRHTPSCVRAFYFIHLLLTLELCILFSCVCSLHRKEKFRYLKMSMYLGGKYVVNNVNGWGHY
jgi:hypothetical protein